MRELELSGLRAELVAGRLGGSIEGWDRWVWRGGVRLRARSAVIALGDGGSEAACVRGDVSAE